MCRNDEVARNPGWWFENLMMVHRGLFVSNTTSESSLLPVLGRIERTTEVVSRSIPVFLTAGAIAGATRRGTPGSSHSRFFTTEETMGERNIAQKMPS